MYLEFKLPSGANGQAAQYVHMMLIRNLQHWSNSQDIAYKTKIHKWTVRVTFDDNKHYSVFALTWNPKSDQMLSYIINYQLIEPMKY